jgi:hypothetical protein
MFKVNVINTNAKVASLEGFSRPDNHVLGGARTFETYESIKVDPARVSDDYLKQYVTVIQFTGLLDKNEREIYYDDIVRYSFYDKKGGDAHDGTALIVRNISNGVGLLMDWDDQKQEMIAVSEGGEIQDYWHDPELWEIEVIGNRFASPNLLKS